MIKEQKEAYEWALNQQFQSVAARYARALAEYIRGLRQNNSFDQVDIPDEVFLSKEAKSCGFSKRSFLEAGWRKIV